MKPANKQFSNLPNDYEMTLSNESVIQECTEQSGDVPAVKYDFKQIAEIGELEPRAIVGKKINICTVFRKRD